MTKILRIGCCDPRTAKEGVYFIGTVGARVIREVVADMELLLERVQELQLVGHHDCLASRVRLGLASDAALDAEQLKLVDEETERFLKQNAQELVGMRTVRMALNRGVQFRLGLDNNQGRIRWKEFDSRIG